MLRNVLSAAANRICNVSLATINRRIFNTSVTRHINSGPLSGKAFGPNYPQLNIQLPKAALEISRSKSKKCSHSKSNSKHKPKHDYCKTIQVKKKEKRAPPPIAPNPCCPIYPKTNPGKFRKIFLFVGLPLIILQCLNAFATGEEECKGQCRNYEYMRRRTKRFPWGDGKKSLFHNDHTNHLPEECVDMEGC